MEKIAQINIVNKHHKIQIIIVICHNNFKKIIKIQILNLDKKLKVRYQIIHLDNYVPI